MKFFDKSSILVVFFCFFIISCSDNEGPGGEQNNFTYLESSEYITSIQESIAKITFTFLAQQYGEAAGMSDEVMTSASVYKITYNTTFQDKKLVASGLICVPDNAGDYPLLSFQNGTNVEYNRAPSVDTNSDLYRMLESVATMGFVVVIPDYPGFGESEQVLHPYLEKENTIPSLTDMLKAAREFVSQSQVDASLNDDLYLMGYSQGGWATMQLQNEIEVAGLENYHLKASACGAGPYDLNYVNSMIVNRETYPMPYFLAFLMHAYQTHRQFPNELNEIFAEEYASKIPTLFDGMTSGGEINTELTTQVSDLLQENYRLGYDTDEEYDSIQIAFENNSIAAWNTSTPTRLYHGANDTFVPLESSEKLKTDFENLGVTNDQVKLIIIPDVNHQSGILPFGFASLNWFLELKKSS